MGKKKLSLKPVNRGIATTSISSKKTLQTDFNGGASNSPSSESLSFELPHQSISEIGDGAPTGLDPVAAPVQQDWEGEDSQILDDQLQDLVDRLHDKGEKEVVRILKSVDFEKRLSRTCTPLSLHEDVRDRVLRYSLEEVEAEREDKLFLPATTTGLDKIYLKVYIVHQVLTRLGYSNQRIDQCISESIGDRDNWETALEWMWLHLDEDECLKQGRYTPDHDPSFPENDTLSTYTPPTSPLPSSSIPTPRTATYPDLDSPAPVASERPLFRSHAYEESSSSSEGDTGLSLDRSSQSWAKLMLQLDSIEVADGSPQGRKGKKNSSNRASLETPEARSLRERIHKQEEDYLFDRRIAELAFKSLKAQRNARALEQRLTGAQEETRLAEPARATNAADLLDDSNSDDDQVGIFGGLLENAEGGSSTAIEDNSTITFKSMPIPRQHTGGLPKNMLRLALQKASNSAELRYSRLSGESRAVRMGLEVRWSPDRCRVWRQEDVACQDTAEAENHVATLALHSLAGELGGINWRSMPPAFRQLWDELEQARNATENQRKKEIWTTIRQFVVSKTQTTVSTGQAASVPLPGSDKPEVRDFVREMKIDPVLQNDYRRRVMSPLYKSMRRYREGLPIAAFRQQILATLASSQVLVLSGETGCGKSTQLPSYILEDHLSEGRACKIIVAEPRRISATSLAQRVSKELGESSGPGSLVGYSIRLEAKMSAATRLAFVTNGIALRMLEGNPTETGSFDEITHIVVDEVHERSLESDFLLMILKCLLASRRNLKVILMSATVDAEKISAYFGNCPCLTVPGRTFPVQANYLEDAVELTEWHSDESSSYVRRRQQEMTGSKELEWAENNSQTDEDVEDRTNSDPTKLSSAKYSKQTVTTINLMDSRQIPYDLIIRLLEKICYESEELRSYSQATLIFMPGLGEIRRLNDMLLSHPAFGTSEFLVYPLHSSISSEGQNAVFNIPSPGIRKIVISTNIAETGVTIPDITCVIDSGKHREMRYNEKRQISRLVETFIARSNAKQRRGRAGRVQEGIAFHLFTRARHDSQLAENPVPEILRLSLQDLALRTKILKVRLGTTIEDVLSRALDPPTSINIQRAILALVEVKALTLNEEITPMGRLLSKLPMDVHLGKFLLIATLFRCLDPALTIAATLNSKSPFIAPFGSEAAADAAKRSFATGHSDFLTFVNVFDSWRRTADNTRSSRNFCQRNYISHQSMQQIDELRQQYLTYLIESSLVHNDDVDRTFVEKARMDWSHGRFLPVPRELNVNAAKMRILNAALIAGLYPKLLCIEDNGGIRTLGNQQTVAIHPTSVNFKLKAAEFDAKYLSCFSLVHSKRLYAWETGPVEDQALVLLCGDQSECKLSSSYFQIDRRIRYQISPKTALAYKILRERFNKAIFASLRGRRLDDREKRWLELGLECLDRGGDGTPDSDIKVV